MPCCQIITTSVEFKVGNIEILKRALNNEGYLISSAGEDRVFFKTKDYYGASFEINLGTSKIISKNINEKDLADKSNAIKRAYSAVVIDEIAKKNKWIKKQMGEGRYQLQRF